MLAAAAGAACVAAADDHSKFANLARSIYTRMAGLRDVNVIQTDKAIHFIDSVAGMYVMTTVHSYIDFDEKRGVCNNLARFDFTPGATLSANGDKQIAGSLRGHSLRRDEMPRRISLA